MVALTRRGLVNAVVIWFKRAMDPDFESESWDPTGPSYIQAYVVSVFILIGIVSVALAQVPVTPLTLIFFSVWFGVLLFWLIQNRRAERTFASDRITVANGRVCHTFRYAITEAEHSSVAVADIKQMKVHFGDAIAVELIGERESDFFVLPNPDAVGRLERSLLAQNPNIKVTK